MSGRNGAGLVKETGAPTAHPTAARHPRCRNGAGLVKETGGVRLTGEEGDGFEPQWSRSREGDRSRVSYWKNCSAVGCRNGAGLVKETGGVGLGPLAGDREGAAMEPVS